MVFWEQSAHPKSNQNPDINTKGFGSGFGNQIPDFKQVPLRIWLPNPDLNPFVFAFAF